MKRLIFFLLALATTCVYGANPAFNDLVWTNNGTYIVTKADTNRVRHAVGQSVFGTNDGHRVTITNGAVTALGFLFGTVAAQNPGSYVQAKEGGFSGAGFTLATNCYVNNSSGSSGGGFFGDSLGCRADNEGGGYGAIATGTSTNCLVLASGALAFGAFIDAVSSTSRADDGALATSYIEGSSNGVNRTQTGSVGGVNIFRSQNVNCNIQQGAGAIVFASDATNSTVTVFRGLAAGQLYGHTNSITSIDSFAFGSVQNNERLYAEAGAIVLGRDVAGTNNFTYGIHGTNAVPLSLALIIDGVRKFSAESNGVVTVPELVNPPGTVSLTADDQSVSVTNRSYIRLSSDNGTAGNRTFVLSSGTVDGQVIELEWTGTNAGEIVDDFTATGGGNGRLSATWTPTQYDVIGLRWNGTDWIERYRSTN